LEKKKASCTKGTQGYTLVELVTVLAIMGILGTMLVSMLDVGVQFYRTADTAMDNQSNARLAIAYITVKIRQNDVTGGISVIPETDSSNNQLQVLQINDASSTSGNIFWIYFDNGTNTLREQSGTDFDTTLGDGVEIAELSSFSIVPTGASLYYTVNAVSADGSVVLTQNITLRSSL
jgi:prepilin-type N-terminal cleavage/methylation domain-containing protein